MPSAMPKIFISYRRSDSEDNAGRIYDRLSTDFGKASVFFDVDTIPFGIDFRDFLKGEVQQCQVLIAIIGPDWLSPQGSDGHRRIDNTADWVRIEIESALARNIPVIPLLVRGARLPRSEELPDSLQNLAYRNAATARAGRDFHTDMDRLVEQLKQYFASRNQTSSPVVSSETGILEESRSLGREQPPKFEFEIVAVDAKGDIANRQQRQAEYRREDLGNGITLDLVKIPGGRFQMGAPAGEENRSDDEGPQHSVTVPEFWLGKYAVTQAQYQAVMGTNPSYFTENGANRPVEQVSWQDAVAFCEKLSQQAGRTYRLPSEAEWEYACRAGTTTPFHFGATITTDLVNYDGDYTYGDGPKGIYREQTTEVGSFPPNAFGLYDMHGNVWEWCADHWHDNYDGAPTNSAAWLSSDESARRLLRGGSWDSDPRHCRSAYRSLDPPGNRNYDLGFRVVCAAARAL
jgi:formylglycine-generating enzyme required for sulfatase activity